MKESDFEKLCDGVKEAGAYRRGDAGAARITDLELPPIKQIRAHLSQAEFANQINVSVRTLQNWEQGTRVPTGPARALLSIYSQHPELLKTG